MDELRRELISQRTRAAIGERKRAGTYRGPQPFADRATVDAIVGLSRRGWSLRKIGRLLDAEGRPPARGGKWAASSVRGILVREQAREPSTP